MGTGQKQLLEETLSDKFNQHHKMASMNYVEDKVKVYNIHNVIPFIDFFLILISHDQLSEQDSAK
jgi:hypothetical protein